MLFGRDYICFIQSTMASHGLVFRVRISGLFCCSTSEWITLSPVVSAWDDLRAPNRIPDFALPDEAKSADKLWRSIFDMAFVL